jgi:transaldolase
MTDPLAALTQAGVSIWLDDLSRDRLTSGSLADLVPIGQLGVTAVGARTPLVQAWLGSRGSERQRLQGAHAAQPVRRSIRRPDVAAFFVAA